MPTLIIRNVTDSTIAALDRLANGEDRSRESYIRRLLAEHVKGETKMRRLPTVQEIHDEIANMGTDSRYMGHGLDPETGEYDVENCQDYDLHEMALTIGDYEGLTNRERADLEQRTVDWLTNGDLLDNPSLEQLRAEWQEYEADAAPDYADILATILDNGRVLSNEDGTYQAASVEIEANFEATERGLTVDEQRAAVAYALAHTKHD